MRLVAFSLVGAVSAAAPLVGQSADGRSNSQLGAVFELALPQGDFAQSAGTHLGIDLWYTYAFDRGRHFGIRMDAAGLIYGNQNQSISLGPYTPGDTGELETTNGIYSLAIGPQVTLGTGWIRPYLTAGVGPAYFATETTVTFGDFYSSTQLYHNTDLGEVVFAWRAALGLQLQLSRGRRPVALDFGGRWVQTGPVRYPREGLVQRQPDGTITISPVETSTAILGVYLGVAIGF